MEKYEPLGVVGEGSYGIVLKCKNRGDGKIVAIKKFIDSEDDPNVRKIALREIRVLKKLRHENLVNLIEVFRRRKHLYLVFEFIDHTLLEQLEQTSHGLDEETCRKYIFQILRGLGFCHENNVIHRDVKPENVLVSKNGIVKLCDFGFARNLCGPSDIYTEYVATRWYRAPELLVGDAAYGKEVDIWAVGCLFAEMSTGEPLFPGDSDIDQLFLIAQCLGRLAKRHVSIMSKNSAFRGFQFPKSRRGSTTSITSTTGILMSSVGGKNGGGGRNSGTEFSSHMNSSSSGHRRRQSPYETQVEPSSSVFTTMFPSWSEEAAYFLTVTLDPEPTSRPTCNLLMRMPYFTHDNFPIRFLSELSTKLQMEGRGPITTTTNSIRKRRSVVASNSNSGVANVSPAFPTSRFTNITSINPMMSHQRSTIFQTQNLNGSNEESQSIQNKSQFLQQQSFQSNNLANQTHFSTSTNLTRQHTFVVGANKDPKIGGYWGRKGSNEVVATSPQSKIPISLTRKSSDEALNSKSTSNNGVVAVEEAQVPAMTSSQLSSTAKEKRFSISHTPKKFSFSVPQSEEAGISPSKNELMTLSLPVPVTTLTFNLGPHNMSYNGSTYTTSTIPAPVRAKSPNFSCNTSTFPLGNQNFRKSSPARIRKKVPLAGGVNFQSSSINNSNNFSHNIQNSQTYHNTRSLPIGVSVLGSSMGMIKSSTSTWSSSNGDNFLPRMTPKNSSIPLNQPGGIDENNPNPLPSLGNGQNGNTYNKKREKLDPLHTVQHSRRSSFSNEFGNIKPFLVYTSAQGQEQDGESFQNTQTKTTTSTLPFM